MVVEVFDMELAISRLQRILHHYLANIEGQALS